jgi:predicted nucleic acid-binding protein
VSGDTRPPFLDSSVVVRYLTDDPPEMAAMAAELIDSSVELVLSEVVLVESAYVLESVYEVPRAELVDALMSLVQRRNIRLLNLSKPLALEALQTCRDSRRHSFSDAVVWAEAVESGAMQIFTFDRRFPSSGLEAGMPPDGET